MRAKRLSASLEDYLRTIYMLIAEKEAARAKDIAKRIGVNRSSVTCALKALARRGLVNYAPYELVTLTSKGKSLAEDLVLRHEELRNFFIQTLEVEEKYAEKTACDMGHIIPRDILKKINSLSDKLKKHSRNNTK